MVTTNLGTLIIYTAIATGEEMGTGIEQEQKPAVFVLVDLGIFMGYLPEQHIEVFARTGRIYLLGKVRAAP